MPMANRAKRGLRTKQGLKEEGGGGGLKKGALLPFVPALTAHVPSRFVDNSRLEGCIFTFLAAG